MALSPSTFETLSDEILMIIIRYSGNVISIFRTFSGLNQRLNGILVDRRLHLLSDFLHINIRQGNFDYYYDTPLFHTISQQLYSLKGYDDEREVNQCFEKLVSFHIQERFRQIKDEYRSSREQFQSIRNHLTNEEIRSRDTALKQAFTDLQAHSINFERLQHIGKFLIGTGARLECTNDELGEYNLAKACNQCLLSHLYTVGYPSRPCLHLLHRLFKALIVSNPDLVNNKDYTGIGVSPVYFFLNHAVFGLQSYNSFTLSMPVTIQKYEIILELLLLCLHYLKQTFNNHLWAKDCLWNSLKVVGSIKNNIDEKILIQCCQMEVLRILFDEITPHSMPFGEYRYDILQGLKNLIVTDRLNMFEYVYRQSSFMQNFLTPINNCHQFMNLITGTRYRRQIFDHLLGEKLLEPWLTSTTLLFVLLKKKECRWIKKLFQYDPTIVHRVDEDGNHPLLYVCLKVNGCRHRMIEWLISMGCDLHKQNNYGEDFTQALRLKRNRKLLKELIEHEIID